VRPAKPLADFLLQSTGPDDAELLSVLSRYTGRSDSTFTSNSQKDLLRAVLHPQHDHIIAVLPTGSGKSIAIFAPPLAETRGVSVVITSHCALRRQLASQAKVLGISHLVWNARNQPDSPRPCDVRLVIMISDEFASDEAKQ
jgi:superfamily II DNA helicase RecQ